MSEVRASCGSPHDFSTDPAGHIGVRGLDKRSHITYMTPQSTSNLQSEFLKQVLLDT